jgi:hypothetical protein
LVKTKNARDKLDPREMADSCVCLGPDPRVHWCTRWPQHGGSPTNQPLIFLPIACFDVMHASTHALNVWWKVWSRCGKDTVLTYVSCFFIWLVCWWEGAKNITGPASSRNWGTCLFMKNRAQEMVIKPKKQAKYAYWSHNSANTTHHRCSPRGKWNQEQAFVEFVPFAFRNPDEGGGEGVEATRGGSIGRDEIDFND